MLGHESSIHKPLVSKQLPWARSRHWVLPAIGNFLSTVSALQPPPASRIVMLEIDLAGPASSALLDIATRGQPTLTMTLWTHLASAAVSCLALEAPAAQASHGLTPASAVRASAGSQQLLTELLGSNVKLPLTSALVRIMGVRVCVDPSRGSLQIQQQQKSPNSNSSMVASCSISNAVFPSTAATAASAHELVPASAQTWLRPASLSSQPEPQATALTQMAGTGSNSSAGNEGRASLSSPQAVPENMASWEASVQASNIAYCVDLGALPTGRLPHSADAWVRPAGTANCFLAAAQGAAMGSRCDQSSSEVAAIAAMEQMTATQGSQLQATARGLLLQTIQPQSAVSRKPHDASYRAVWMAEEPTLLPQQRMQGMSTHSCLMPPITKHASIRAPVLKAIYPYLGSAGKIVHLTLSAYSCPCVAQQSNSKCNHPVVQPLSAINRVLQRSSQERKIVETQHE